MTVKEGDKTEQQLLAGLKDKDKDVRLVCAMGLSASRKPEFIEPVVSMMGKITWEEVEDLAALVSCFGPPAVPSLIRLLGPSKKSTAACVMRALGKIGGATAAEALVQQLVSLPTKSEPTEALVTMQAAAIPYLLPLLEHSKADVRAMAAFALGKIGDKSSLKVLGNLADADKSEKVQGVAYHAANWVRGQTGCNIDLRNTFGEIELGPR